MARKKNSGAAADTKHNKATRQARRDRKLTTKGKELQRQQQKESAEETNLKKSLANLGLNTQEESLNNSFANLGLGTFEEDKMAAAAARNKTTQKEPSRPVEIGDHVEVEESIRKEFIARDPDMANYKMVYMVDPNHRLLILRFPNRRANEAYCGRDGCKPLELRIKPKSGHVELDVPIYFKLPETEHQMNFMYQKALRESSTLQQGGSYGLAGGFGVNDEPEPSKKGKGKAKEKPKTPAPDTEDSENPRNYGPMQKITLGGMIQRYDDTKPRLMAGTFKGNVLYLSHVDAVVELTVNFQHRDALSDVDKTSALHQRNTERGKQMERDRQMAQKLAEAKDVNLTVKSTEPEEGMPEGRSKIKEMLQDIADEPWQRMKWVDQDDPESYRAFDEHFGLNKNVDELPSLVSTMTPEQYLDVISCPRYDHTTNRFREMTFPKKGKVSHRLEGTVDEDGNEYVDANAPREAGYEYSQPFDVEYTDDEEDDSGEDEDEEYDSDEEEEESEDETDTEWETVSEDDHL